MAATIICMTQGIAIASGVTGKISRMSNYYDGTYAYITVNLGVSNTSCGKGVYVVRSDNPSFKLMAAVLLTAFQTDHTVNVIGFDTCNINSSREDLQAAIMHN